MRLQKYLAECGVASRRESEQVIAAGRVTVNGSAAAVGDQVDPGTDEVALDGRLVLPRQKVYVVLHKPKGVITSVKDTHDRKTVLDCLDGVRERVFPVGRLDKDVAGALLLTNDGELSFRLTHPKFEVDKVYLAWVRGRIEDATCQKLERGVELEDGVTSPANVRVLKRTTTNTLIRLTIHEGRKRLVKRMLASVGHPVTDLRRVSIAGVSARGLQPGEWRYLDAAEVESLQRRTGIECAT